MPAPALGLTARARINRVIDGDTVEVICLGMAVTIRLRNCWAPELHRGPEESKAKGKAAKRFLEQLATPQRSCTVRVPTSHAMRLSDVLTFGRVVGDIWLCADDHSISELMVAEGFATREKE